MNKLITVLLILAGSLSVAATLPVVTPASIAAVLGQPTPYVDIQYTWGKEAALHYTRTPEMLRLDSKDGAREVTASFDRQLSEFRSLSGTSGTISEEVEDLLSTQITPEVGLYNLYDGPLFEVVKKGTITGTDGDLIIVKTVTETAEYAFWLDSKLGYCPRKLTITRDKGNLVKTVDFENYTEITKGSWLPYKVHHVLVIAGETKVDAFLLITKMSLASRPSRADLTVSFPSGTLVTCGTVAYQVP